MHIVFHIFFHTALTVALMIHPPMHCLLVYYYRAENELQYSSNVVQGDSNSQQIDSTRWQYECAPGSVCRHADCTRIECPGFI